MTEIILGGAWWGKCGEVLVNLTGVFQQRLGIGISADCSSSRQRCCCSIGLVTWLRLLLVGCDGS